MESQTESSQLQDQVVPENQPSLDQPPLQSQELSSESGNSNEEPNQVIGTEESPENAVLGAAEDNPELLANAEEAEAPSQDEQHSSDEQAPEPTQQAIEFNSFNDIKLDSMPEDVQAYVKPIMSLVAQEVSTMKAEKEAFESARKEFTDLIDEMESSGNDVKPLQSRIDEQNEFIGSMSSEMIDTAWQAFTITNPEYGNIPDNARELFAKELESLYEKYDGKTVLDRMNDAYSYSLWKSGVDKNTLKGKKYDTVQPEKAKQTKATDESASKQAIIADGRIATSAPVRSVSELDWSEVLDRHAHLLDR